MLVTHVVHCLLPSCALETCPRASSSCTAAELWQMWVCENLFTTPVKCQELGKTMLSLILLCGRKGTLVAEGFGIRGGIFKCWFSLLLFLSSFESLSCNSGF